MARSGYGAGTEERCERLIGGLVSLGNSQCLVWTSRRMLVRHCTCYCVWLGPLDALGSGGHLGGKDVATGAYA